MARSIITKEQWEKAKEYFEHGLTLGDITKRTGISKGALSKKSKSENWDLESPKKLFLSQAVDVSIGKETLKETPVAYEVHQELHDEATRRKNLVYGVQERAVKKAGKMLDELDSAQDLRHIVEAVDKASITLGVNQRHANSQTNINNTNAQQNNISVEEISQAIADGLPD